MAIIQARDSTDFVELAGKYLAAEHNENPAKKKKKEME